MAKNKKININSELKVIAEKMTILFKNQIKKQKLIKTGKLYASIEVKLKNTKKGLAFEVKAVDYFVYVDANYNVTENVINSKSFQRLEKQLMDVYNLYLEQELLDF